VKLAQRKGIPGVWGQRSVGRLGRRYYGLSERLLPKYAWYLVNGEDRTCPRRKRSKMQTAVCCGAGRSAFYHGSSVPLTVAPTHRIPYQSFSVSARPELTPEPPYCFTSYPPQAGRNRKNHELVLLAVRLRLLMKNPFAAPAHSQDARDANRAGRWHERKTDRCKSAREFSTTCRRVNPLADFIRSK
jgi:hypothetical protein